MVKDITVRVLFSSLLKGSGDVAGQRGACSSNAYGQNTYSDVHRLNFVKLKMEEKKEKRRKGK